jgi:hypothetical protein
MVVVKLPRGVRIRVLAYTRARARQRMTVDGGLVHERWVGRGERVDPIGSTEIEIEGIGTFNLNVTCEHYRKGKWRRSEEHIRGPYAHPFPGDKGRQLYVRSEDWRDSDWNDAVVRFIWEPTLSTTDSRRRMSKGSRRTAKRKQADRRR